MKRHIRRLRAPHTPAIDLDDIIKDLNSKGENFVLANVREKHQQAIVYTNDGFCSLTGYLRSEVVRQDAACEFLTGPLTNEQTLHDLKHAVSHRKEFVDDILLYRADGSYFWSKVEVSPIRDQLSHHVIFLIVSHRDITVSKMHKRCPSTISMSSYRLVWDQSDNSLPRQPTLHGPDGVVMTPDSVILNELLDKEQRHTVKEKFMNAISLHREVLPEYRDEVPNRGRFIILHYSLIRELWDWLIIFLCIYAAIVIPYNITFNSEGILVFDLLIDAIFFVDIVLNFRTTYTTESGKLVVNPKRIAVTYLKTWFVVDCISFLPLELYFVVVGKDDSLAYLIHAPKILRLSHLLRVVHKLVWRDRYMFGISVLVILMVFYSLISHWLACIWVAIGRLGGHYSWFYLLANTTGDYFYYNNNGTLEGGPSDESIYLSALYFTVTSLTTVGFGNIAANTVREKAFAVFIMIIGALFHAIIFGNITAIIANLYAHSSKYRSRYSDLHEYIRMHEIKDPLKQRLLDHFHAVWLHKRGIETDEVFRDFPEELQADVCMHLHRTLLSTNPAFAKASPGCLRKLSLKLKFMHSAPGEYIAHQGDPLNKLFFVCSGSLEVLVHNEVMAILGAGDAFGQDFYNNLVLSKTVADVRVLSYCDLQYIHRNDLIETFQLYPNFGPEFSANIDISYDLRMNVRQRKNRVSRMRPGSPYKRQLQTIEETIDDTSCSQESTEQDGQRYPRVTFQIGDTSGDITPDPSNPLINATRSNSIFSQDTQSNGIEGYDSGLPSEGHLTRSQNLEFCKRELDIEGHVSRIETRMARLEVGLNKIIKLVERPGSFVSMTAETSV